MQDDLDLLRRYAADRSEPAFAAFVGRNLPFVYAVALRKVGGDAHHAADVAQGVFVTVARHPEKLLQARVVLAWLHTMTCRVAANLVRTERRRLAREEKAHIMEELTKDATELVTGDELRPVIDDALASLNEREREAVLLRYFQGKGFTAIGAELSLSPDAARLRIERALEKMRKSLSRRGVASTAAVLAAVCSSSASMTMPAGLAGSITGTALASAAAGSGAISFFTFMSITKIQYAMIGLLAAASVSGLWLQHSTQAELDRQVVFTAQRGHELARVRQQNVELKTKIEQLQQSLATLEKRPVAEQASVPNYQKSKSLQSSMAANPSANREALFAARPPRHTNPLKALWGLRNNPEAMELWLKAQGPAVEFQFDALFEKLNLDEPQKEKFKQIVLEKYGAIADVATAAQSQGLLATSPELKSMLQEITDKTETAAHTLLGDDGYAFLAEFSGSMATRDIVKAVAADVYDTPSPLSHVQSEQLVKIIAQYSVAGSKGKNPDTANWDAILSDASRVLTPLQSRALAAERAQLQLGLEFDQMAITQGSK